MQAKAEKALRVIINHHILLHIRTPTKKNGDVYFAILAYSGNFKVKAERDLFKTTRVIIGMSDFDFRFELKAYEQFDTPKVFCGHTGIW